jgi:integrase
MEHRGWLQYRSREPLMDTKTGELKTWHKLCPVGPGDEFKARVVLQELLSHAHPGKGDFAAAFARWRLEFFKARDKDAPWLPERRELFLNANKSLNSFFDVIAKSFCDANVADIKPFHINKFLKAWDGRRAAQAYRGHLVKFFAWATGEGFRESNPATSDVVQVKQPKKRNRTITPAQFHAVRDAVIVTARGKTSGEMIQCYIDLTYLLYQRTTDVRLLRWTEIDEASRVHVKPTKTEFSSGVAMNLPMSPAIGVVLARVKKIARMGSVFVFHTTKGQPYTASGIRSTWNRACKRAGVEGITLKDLRSMAATAAEASGFSRKQIQAALGHKKQGTTDGYIHSDNTIDSEVVLSLPERPKT